MKGGTTAGITNLNKHKDISMTKNEIQYFDNLKNYQKGIEWYKTHFDYSKKVIGDKSPNVFCIYYSLQLLQLVNPHIKIILFLRNPIERAYSHWKMLRDVYNVKTSFEDIINDEIMHRMEEPITFENSFWLRPIWHGFYYKHIMEILKYFSKDNLYICISEKIKNNMDLEYNKLFKFLEIDEFHGDFVEDYVSKNKDTLDKNNILYKKLKKIYSDDVKKLEKFLDYKTNWF
jgi:hypothetical protein